jgi:hypothetical protein
MNQAMITQAELDLFLTDAVPIIGHNGKLYLIDPPNFGRGFGLYL